jgi:fatty-acyl-CoA synthase
MLLSSTVVVTQKFDPERVLALIERWQCDVLVAVPVMLQRIMDLAPEVRNSYDTSTLRVVAVSGSALPKALASSFVREFGYILYSLYGSTEVAFATVATPADLVTAPGTAGHPLPSVSVKVLGSHGQDCPPRVPGSIHVQGNESIVDQSLDPDGRAGGSSRTGDIGWFDEAGRLFVGGREDEMVITGGENVYPITVESALLEHPEVVEAAVIGIPDRQFGEVLEAHVVTSPGSKLKSEDLQAWCRRRLASFQVPRSVVIQTALPRNETGKVIKSQLRSRILSSQSA